VNNNYLLFHCKLISGVATGVRGVRAAPGGTC